MKASKFTEELAPASATHPGVLLHDELEYRGITSEELALWMKVDPLEVRVVIAGEKPINAEFALKIERTLGVDAFYWLRMQAKYDIDSLRLKEWKHNHDLLNADHADAMHVTKEPKSAYASLGKRRSE